MVGWKKKIEDKGIALSLGVNPFFHQANKSFIKYFLIIRKTVHVLVMRIQLSYLCIVFLSGEAVVLDSVSFMGDLLAFPSS